MRTAPFLIFIIDVSTRIVKRALWHTAELSGRPKASPFGRGVTKGDGEGKPVTAGLLCSDKQKSLSERYYRCACISSPASLPSQALRASSPKVGATGVPVRPKPDEQSPIFHKQECPAVKANSSLTKCAYPEPSTQPVPQRAREPDAFCRIPLYSDAFMLPLTYRILASFYSHFSAFSVLLGVSKMHISAFLEFPAFSIKLETRPMHLIIQFYYSQMPFVCQ